jgi:hypothetical protein
MPLCFDPKVLFSLDPPAKVSMDPCPNSLLVVIGMVMMMVTMMVA